MIVFTTRDWLGHWDGGIDVGHIYGGGLFTIDPYEANAYEVAEAFAAWLMEPERPWIMPEEWWGDEPAPDDWQEHMLAGDLVLCVPVVMREAAVQGKAPEAHFAHLVVHGMLHLQGHDHENEAEAAVMERLETDVLRGLGYADPYA